MDIGIPADQEAVAVAPDLVVESNNTLLIAATARISVNYIAGEDSLDIGVLWPGMEVDFDSEQGLLTIRGAATAFEYEEVLRSLLFVDSAEYRTPRTIAVTIQVFDGLSVSSDAVVFLDIAHAPFIYSDIDNVASYTIGKEESRIGVDLSISYMGPITSATVTITSGFEPDQDALVIPQQQGISTSFDATTGQLTLSGNASPQVYAQLLGNIRYINSRFNPTAGDRMVSLQVFSGETPSNQIQTLISVEAILVSPTIDVGSIQSFVEDGPSSTLFANLALEPRDNLSPLAGETNLLHGAIIEVVNYVEGEDLLVVENTANILGDFNPDQGRMYLTGTASFEEYETILQSVRYINSSDAPTTGVRQIALRLLASNASGYSTPVVGQLTVVGTSDSLQLIAGDATDVSVIQNSDAIDLGLSDLRFQASENLGEEIALGFRVTKLPPESLGSILFADGTRVQIQETYPIESLQGMTFTPLSNRIGSATLDFAVAIYNSSTGVLDNAAWSKSMAIVVAGVETRTAVEAYIAEISRELFGRNPTPGELSDLSNKLNQKLRRVGISTQGFESANEARMSLLEEIVDSDLFRRQEVAKLYSRILDRDPTETEISSQLNSQLARRELRDLLIDLIASDEYFDNHDRSNSQFATSIYQDLVQRDPTLTEWNRVLRDLRFGISRREVAEVLLDQSATDPAVFDATIERLLHRAPTFDDQFAFTFESLDGLRLNILASEEYFDQVAVPTISNRLSTDVTNGFPSVGKLGDAAGDRATGTLIAPQYVLAAAHSVVGIPPGQLNFTLDQLFTELNKSLFILILTRRR